MSNCPFIYGHTVTEDRFVNRLAERKKLKNNLKSGISTTLISPRRWGKSSLVELVANELAQEKKSKVIVLDLFSYQSIEEFLEAYARAVVQASSSKMDDWLAITKRFFQSLIPKVSVKPSEELELQLSFDMSALLQSSEEVLDLPEKIAKEQKIRFVICLDEFQNLAEMKGFSSFEKRLRASWQRHQNVSYCLYGSKRHMMSEIFNDPSKPFYRFGDIMLLERISKKHWKDFIYNSFFSTGKRISEDLAGEIPVLMNNHSWYVQQLSHYAWMRTRNICTEEILLASYEELINANAPLFRREIEFMSRTLFNTLRAIASGEKRLTSASVMDKYQLGTPNNVRKNKLKLIELDIIDQTEKGLEFLDPAFERWFRKEIFGESLKLGF